MVGVTSIGVEVDELEVRIWFFALTGYRPGVRAARRAVVAGLGAAALVLATPSLAGAALSITVPSSASLGSAPTGSTKLSAQLGTVTVTYSGLVTGSFTATVSASNFTTGGATTRETISKGSISYWSGPATASSGLASSTPGQLTSLQAVDLSTSRTAFSGTGLLLSYSLSWKPTVVVNIPASAVAGAYTGTVTHSVA